MLTDHLSAIPGVDSSLLAQTATGPARVPQPPGTWQDPQVYLATAAAGTVLQLSYYSITLPAGGHEHPASAVSYERMLTDHLSAIPGVDSSLLAQTATGPARVPQPPGTWQDPQVYLATAAAGTVLQLSYYSITLPAGGHEHPASAVSYERMLTDHLSAIPGVDSSLLAQTATGPVRVPQPPGIWQDPQVYLPTAAAGTVLQLSYYMIY